MTLTRAALSGLVALGALAETALAGTPVPAPAVALVQAGDVQPGQYECYALSGGMLSARPGLNFTITGAGTYFDVENSPGSYRFDAGSQILTFVGAALDGQRARYNSSSNPRTISYLNAAGEPIDECDLQR